MCLFLGSNIKNIQKIDNTTTNKLQTNTTNKANTSILVCVLLYCYSIVIVFCVNVFILYDCKMHIQYFFIIFICIISKEMVYNIDFKRILVYANIIKLKKNVSLFV